MTGDGPDAGPAQVGTEIDTRTINAAVPSDGGRRATSRRAQGLAARVATEKVGSSAAPFPRLSFAQGDGPNAALRRPGDQSAHRRSAVKKRIPGEG